ncbi:MAG: aminotransferase class I/II-fold pyridoxal phosphate-dependent enzyme [Verrucomicrobia bacterium]|nr:MAG: aminotransferase class I/II-fold pyridoxal phosphate-dependent enzyme [Verrucomicrobiota bacterium]
MTTATTPAIDLRSDTVTRPTPAMRDAIARAEVGDDQFGEDPSINRLQERAAELLGKEAALWVPTGTMANQVALRTLTRPGDDVITSRGAHAVWFETGAGAANAGVQFTEIGENGVFSVAEFLDACKPRDHLILPPTTVVMIENPHNRAGGIVFPQDEAAAICAAAHERGVTASLDGARLWNAAVASGRSAAELAAPFDLVSVCFSKGLGAPGGSLLAGSAEMIRRARRYRRMAGGAMRQAGFLAAACLHALDHHIDRLAEDHANARLLATELAASDRVRLDLATVQTNIVCFAVTDDAPDAATIVARARQRGVLLFALGPRLLRLVTHLDVDTAQCQRAARILREVIETPSAP